MRDLINENSETPQKNKFKNIPLYLLITIVLLFIIYIAFSMLNNKFDTGLKESSDYATANVIQLALTQYIVETDDKNLTFGEGNETIFDVNKVLLKLQQPNTINGKQYNSNLTPKSDPPKAEDYLPASHAGWKITITKEIYGVSVEPDNNGNSIVVN